MGIKTAQLWLGGGWKLERKSPGAFRSVWELPVLEPSHWEHKKGKRSKSNRIHVFHLGRAEVQSQVGMTAAGLPGDLPPVHHKQATPEEFYGHSTQERHSFVWEMGWYLFVLTQHWTKGQFIPCLHLHTLKLLKHFRSSHRKGTRTALLIQDSDVSALNAEAMFTVYD